MEMNRTELMPGVWLNTLRSDKFKTACLSVNLLTQLTRETASMNALLPYVLRRGCARYEDMDAISARLDELYGTAIEPVVRRIGEIQSIGFYASIPESAFLPGKEDVLRPACELLGELLLHPATRGGLLLPKYVDSEREKMLDTLRARVNEKRSYSVMRCIEEMCCFEDFSAGRLGSVEEMKNVRYQKLSKRYRSLLQSCPVEIFYCGRADRKKLAACLREILATMPRGEIDYELGTEIRMNALEDQPREVTEPMDVSQGKLVIGFRLGECMDDPDPAALTVFNGVFGSGSTSKLFANVREKLHLCYYAGSMLEMHKGLLLVASGIDFDKKELVQEEIFRQLDAVRRGEISDEELQAARAGAASELRMSEDSQGELEGFWLSQIISGLDYGPAELAELCEEVTKEDVMAVAQSVDCDLIYFLTGNEEDEEDEEGESADGDEQKEL